MSASELPNRPLRLDAQRLAAVVRHKNYRGLTVDRNLLAQFTMYTVHLEDVGTFISDSRHEAFNMAFEALSTRPLS